MDYKEYLAGRLASNFWVRAKISLLEKMLKKYANSPKPLKILSIGAGTGEELSSLNKFGKVYVVDIEKRVLELIPKNICVEKKICDACKLSYPNEFFDIVVVLDVFEHIAQDELAINECRRVLKKKEF